MSESSDRELLDLIRRGGPLTVAEMARQLAVTGTAVRNRLSRLLAAGLVERKSEHGARGRPRHRYQASIEAHKRLGQNYADLAVALWEEMMRSVADRKLRRLLFTRITDRLADVYRTRVTGQEWEGRLVQLSSILHDRGVEAEVARDETSLDLILRQHSCPYYELAETDPAICALRAQDVREGPRPRFTAQSVPARWRSFVRLSGQAGTRPCRGTKLCRSGTMIAIRTTGPTLLAGGGRVGTVNTGLLFCAQPATPGMAESPFKKRWADNVEAFGGQLQRVWFNDDVDLNRVND